LSADERIARRRAVSGLHRRRGRFGGVSPGRALPAPRRRTRNFHIRCTVNVLVSTDVLSVRVRRELKEEALRLGVDVRAVVEKALEEEVRRVKRERFRRLLEEALKGCDVTVEEWVKAVKEARRER